jgi:hypothetical protein
MLNIIRSLFFAVFAVSVLVGCRQSAEAKVLGSWDASAIDASNRITFNPDHTFEGSSSGMGGTLPFKGSWRIKGDQLLIRYDGKEPISSTMVAITSDEIRFKDTEGSFTWKRIR